MNRTTVDPMSRFEMALKYAAMGWYVFPIYEIGSDGKCSCGGLPKCSPGKHPRVPKGLLEATIDTAVIGQWITKFPDANIGIATGPSGLNVLDIDPKNGGIESLEKLKADHGDVFLATLRAKTGSGGLHIYYTNKDELGNTAGIIAPGVDTRGMGGYVVAPASNHASGGTYEWAKNMPLDITSLASTPDWLIKLIKAGKPGKDGPAPAVADRIGKGARNQTAASLAGTMHRRGFVKDAIHAALVVQSRETFDPPMSDEELWDVVDSVSRYKRTPKASIEKPVPTAKSLNNGYDPEWFTWRV